MPSTLSLWWSTLPHPVWFNVVLTLLRNLLLNLHLNLRPYRRRNRLLWMRTRHRPNRSSPSPQQRARPLLPIPHTKPPLPPPLHLLPPTRLFMRICKPLPVNLEYEYNFRFLSPRCGDGLMLALAPSCTLTLLLFFGSSPLEMIVCRWLTGHLTTCSLRAWSAARQTGRTCPTADHPASRVELVQQRLKKQQS